MATNLINTARILTSLAPLKSWRPQLSNDAKIVKIRAVLMRFVAMFLFLLIFVAKNAKKTPKLTKKRRFSTGKNRPKSSKMPTKRVDTGRLVMILVSLDS